MNILVIGGTGFVSSHTVQKLILNHNVTLLNRGTETSDVFPNLHKISGNTGNKEQLESALSDYDFDCVIDFSWYANQTANIIDVVTNKIRFYVYVSTANINNMNDVLDCDEDDWKCNYSNEKFLGEQYVKDNYTFEDKLGYLIIRPGALCGDRDTTNRFDYSEWPNVYELDSNELVPYQNVDEFSKSLVEYIDNGYYGVIEDIKSYMHIRQEVAQGMPDRDDDVDVDTNNYPDRSDEEDVLSKKSYRNGKYGKIYKENLVNDMEGLDICPDCGKPIDDCFCSSVEQDWFSK